MDKQLILAALERLGALADDEGLKLEICIYGGAALLLAYESGTVTKDVDAVVLPTKEGKRLSAVVAREMGLPEDWLNDQVKMFAAPVATASHSIPGATPIEMSPFCSCDQGPALYSCQLSPSSSL